MKYLVFTNTPAHVHLYRNAVTELRAAGHDVLVLARDYGCTVDLLEWYDLPYSVYGRCGTSKYSLVRNLPGQYARIFRTVLSYEPDLVFGMGGYAAHAGAVSRSKTILLLDSEPTGLDHLVSTPFAHAVLTPAAFRKDLGSDHYVFDGFKESAYLHPETFTPNPSVRDRLGVGDDRYVVVRFNAFGSHHDVGEHGFGPAERRRLLDRLADHATVLVSDEGGDLDLDSLPAEPFDVHPALMHDALAEAALLVADTQTIVTEAALLGTPTIRSNSFVGKSDMGNFVELGERGLVRNVRSLPEVLAAAEELLTTDGTAETWRRRRDEYLAEMVNLTDLILAVAEAPDALDSIGSLRRRSGTEDSDGVVADPVSTQS